MTVVSSAVLLGGVQATPEPRAFLAKQIGRPVKFKHTRRESFHDCRQQATYTAQVGAQKDGRFTTG